MSAEAFAIIFLSCSLFVAVESGKAYIVSSSFSPDHYCDGALDVDDSQAQLSPDGCANAVAAESNCGDYFHFVAANFFGDAHLCRCVQVTSNNCTPVDNAGDPTSTSTIYKLVTALYVAGDTNAFETHRPDYSMKTLLEGVGFSISLIDDDYVSSSSAGAHCDYDLIVVSSSVSGDKVGSKFNICTSPLVTWEFVLFDYLGMTPQSEDSCSTSMYVHIEQSAFDAGDPLTAGLSGSVQIFSSSYKAPLVSQSHGELVIGTNNARVVATNSYDKAIIFYYESGATLADNTIAAGMRISTIPWFRSDDALPPLTDDGRSLIEASFRLGLPATCLGSTSNCQQLGAPTTVAPITTMAPITTTALITTTSGAMIPTTTMAPTTTRALITGTSRASITTTGAAAPITSTMHTIAVTTTVATTAATISGTAFVGEMIIAVANAAELVQEPNVTTVIALAVADLYNISVAWIQNVEVSLRTARRLSRLRRAVDSDAVDVRWEIDIPAHGGDGAVVKVYADRFNAKTLSEVTFTVNTFLNSGALAGQYTGDVQWVYIIPEEESVPKVKPQSEEGGNLALVIIVTAAGAVVSLSGMAIVLCIAWHRAKKGNGEKRKRGKRLTDCSIGELINPPANITDEDAMNLHALCEQIASSYDANFHKTQRKVCVIYATGRRDGDAEGVGPGSYFAAAVAKVLNYHGVPCLFDMIWDADQPSRFFTSQLTQKADCQVLIVIQTQALYHCQDCLKGIYVGQQSKLKLLPLRFEAHLPEASATWPEVTRNDLEGMLMVSEVHQNFCKLNSTPVPPWTVCNQPNALVEIAHDLQRSLDIAVGHTAPVALAANAPVALAAKLKELAVGHTTAAVVQVIATPKEVESPPLETNKHSMASVPSNVLVHMESAGKKMDLPFESDDVPFLENQDNQFAPSDEQVSKARRNKIAKESAAEGRSDSKRRAKSVDVVQKGEQISPKISYGSTISTKKNRRPREVDGCNSAPLKIGRADLPVLVPESKRSKDVAKSPRSPRDIRRERSEPSQRSSDDDMGMKKADSKVLRPKQAGSLSSRPRGRMLNDGDGCAGGGTGKRTRSTPLVRPPPLLI